MLLNRLMLLALLASLLPQQGAFENQTRTVNPNLPARLTHHKECTSIDIRNDCDKMELLENCTIVTGYVMITLVFKEKQCNFSAYSFPMLREVTDFMIFTEVRGLVRIRDLFPNLTVIRGRRLFLNYALGITNMQDLQLLEFQSLVAIQQGHVYIGNCPKLCQTEGINWDRLTLTPGENHIMLDGNNCTEAAECKDCPSRYCWSNSQCQRLENDNLSDQNGGIQCHDQCLGGCYNVTAADCVTCRGLSDDGVCVESCPPHKYTMEQYNRCYTRDQCVGHHGHYTFGFDCVPFCPSGYKINSQLDCVRCSPNEPCISVCTPDLQNEAFIVYNLADAHELYGCQILNSSLVFTIRNKVQEKQLAHSLSTIREIRGHLKIYRSSQLTSLQFLKNIQRIHGDPLENKYYALVLYDNKEIRELWTPDAELEFLNGGMYMHRNNKLCNRHMREFQAQVIHDKTLDSLQTNDQEVLCGPAKLLLNVHVRSHRMVQLSWLKSQTSVELELIYRPVAEGQIYPEQSELEAPICTRINWQRRLLFPEQLLDNGTHYNYQLGRLTSDTRYALLLRTFGGEFKREARSDLTFVRTQKDIPEPPQLQLSKKTDNSLTLLLSGSGNSSLDYYELRIYELADDAAYIDERDYCKQPAVLLQDMDGDEWSTPVEDYDDCCSHQQELSDDRRFIEDMRSQYRCSLDEPTNCELWQQPKDSIQLHLSGNTTTHILHDLKRYHLYSLQLRACNELGCSSHTTLNERTNYTLGGDFLPDLSACRVPSTDEYIVRFNDPVQPNGVILSYVLHYRNILSDSGTVMESHVNCLTRRAHAAADFEHVALLNMTFNQCAVRVHSLAGDVLTPFVPINWCDEEQRSTHRPHAHSTTTEQALTNKTNSGVASTVTSPTTTASHARGISFFVVCFLFGCLATMLWVMYKRRCWRKLPGLRHYVPVREQWLRERQQTEDREILVDGFETVRFHNNNNSNNADAY